MSPIRQLLPLHYFTCKPCVPNIYNNGSCVVLRVQIANLQYLNNPRFYICYISSLYMFRSYVECETVNSSRFIVDKQAFSVSSLLSKTTRVVILVSILLDLVANCHFDNLVVSVYSRLCLKSSRLHVILWWLLYCLYFLKLNSIGDEFLVAYVLGVK